ncbi:MAG: hypothetical protein JXB39_07025 [Deltaproteobacteria bacterium]|nr:hypothetical protein [Deltaproteobacteria bacterium]
MRSPFLLLASATLCGCSFDENLPEIEIVGTVTVPRAAATRTITDDEGHESEVTDVRFIGPVYLGAFPDVTQGAFRYPHPDMGPILDAAYPGDTYPYGGTSVGRFDFACLESVACQVTTGRFASFEQILEYFNEWADDPVLDPYGEEVTSVRYYEQYCFWYYYATSYDELGFLAVERQEDGTWVPDLDFEENEDGDFVAEFSMPHTLYVEGMKIWGWVDSPSQAYTFSTCDSDRPGPARYDYDMNFEAGGSHQDILNYPSLYIYQGDWIVSEAWQMTSPEDKPEIVLDFAYE